MVSWREKSEKIYDVLSINISSSNIIGHNNGIKDRCFMGPHAVVLGSTTIEPYCVISANSTIRDGGIIIARECIIAAGTTIGKDTKEGGVYR